MGFFESLFGAAKVLIRGVLPAIRDVVVELATAFGGPSTGKVVKKAIESWTQTKAKAYNRAEELAEEEAELAQKMARDGRLTEADWERKHGINAQRDALDAQHAKADAERLAEDLDTPGAVAVNADADEISSTIGLIPHRRCDCGKSMRLRTSSTTRYGEEYTKFWWSCPSCGASEKFDPLKEAGAFARAADSDLDVPVNTRHRIWNEPKTLAETNIRIRKHIGRPDPDVLCPDHRVPMRLAQLPGRGRVLDGYAYCCPGVTIDGHGCMHVVSLGHMAQASAALRRYEGVGIIKNRPAEKIGIYTGGVRT